MFDWFFHLLGLKSPREMRAMQQDAEGALRELEAAIAGKEALKAENGRLQQELHYARAENAKLEARNTALQKTLEAQPTAPKRAAPRRGAQATGEEA